MYVDFPKWISPFVIPSLPVRWYAVMYLLAFGTCYILFRRQCDKEGALNHMDYDTSLTLFCYTIGFLLIGARLFSTLLYDGSWYYWTHPWMIFWPFRNGRFIGLPGMSYHGGVVGAVFGGWLFARKYKYRLLDLSDTVIAGIPLGYTFGRLGNFINGELWGRVTGTSYGMVFPEAPSFSTTISWVRDIADKIGMQYIEGDIVNLPRHPSQLYEAFFEGIFLFLMLWFIVKPLATKHKDEHGPGMITGAYFVGYGAIRFVLEYFREPDSQLGFIIKLGKEWEPTALFKSVLNISLGQILCLIMVIAGIEIIVYAKKSAPTSYKPTKSKKVKRGK